MHAEGDTHVREICLEILQRSMASVEMHKDFIVPVLIKIELLTLEERNYNTLIISLSYAHM